MKRLTAVFLAIVLLLFSIQALASYTTLQLGSSGNDVLQLQTALNQLGYSTGGIDGKFGAATRKAVMLYQASKGLKADGKAGTLTLTSLYTEMGTSSSSALISSVSTVPTVSVASGGVSSQSSTLRYGSSGSQVTKLQNALKQLGYSIGSADGKFGLATLSAVRSFQSDHGLTADGLAGSATQTLLYALISSTVDSSAASSSAAQSTVTSDPSFLFTVTLRVGSSGSAVLAAQRQLQALGYYSGSLDGKYGTGTQSAVRNFQSANGLTADGLLGKASWKKLFSDSAVSSGSTVASSSSASASSSTASSASSSSSFTTISSSTDESGTLRSGSSGDAVLKLQKALQALGWSISADGKYGSGTAAAVKAFQERNGLTANGIADSATLQKLCSSDAQGAVIQSGSEASNVTHGTATGNNGATIHLLHWFNEVKPNLSYADILIVYDPATGISWNLKVLSCGRHCDSEPATAADTANMNQAFGGETTWTPKAVYVKLPSGVWSLAATHNTAHLSGNVKDNEFDGHLCVHFLRDMSECVENDPNYGVTNQNTIRQKWKEMTGVTVN